MPHLGSEKLQAEKSRLRELSRQGELHREGELPETERQARGTSMELCKRQSGLEGKK